MVEQNKARHLTIVAYDHFREQSGVAYGVGSLLPLDTLFCQEIRQWQKAPDTLSRSTPLNYSRFPKT